MPSTSVPRRALETLAQRAVVVELALVVAALIGVSAYSVAVDAALDPYFLDSDTSLLLLRSALVLLGIGALTATYAAWRDYSLRESMPATSDAPLVGAAVAVAALLAVPPFALLTIQTGTGVEHVASTLADVGAVFTLRTLTRIALFAVGMALLGHALVQGSLGRVLGDRGVVATTLLGGYLAAPTTINYGTFAAGPWLPAWGRRAAVALLFVLALGVVVAAERRVADDRLRTLSTLPLLAAVALVVLTLAAAADSPGGAVVTVTRAAVIGVAAYAYDATDSLLVPALAYAAFAVVSRMLYAATIAAAFGG